MYKISITNLSKQLLLAGAFLISINSLLAQNAEDLINNVKAKLGKVNDYEASGTMRTNVLFIKAPIASVKVYYKKPNQFRISNEKGISFIPKGSFNIQLGNIFTSAEGYSILDLGKDSTSGLRVIKLLPKDETSDVVLSKLYIDEANAIIKRALTTTRENGTYELEMTYGKYAAYGLADKVIFTFNTKDYKLPKGITFDYDDGSSKESLPEKTKNKKGRVEITYASYTINKGVPDSVFQ